MSKNNSFYVLYSKDKNVRDYLNSIKLLCDYNQRTEAHITVRGPYKNKLSSEIIETQNSIIKNEKLIISNVENFFPFNNQNTVFFKCDDNENLKKIWKKITYNEFRPHITMYDGKDFNFAQNIFSILTANFKPFIYEVDKLSFLEPKGKDSLGLYSLKNVFDYSFFKEVLDVKISIESLTSLKNVERLNLIEKLSKILFNELTKKHYR